MYNFVVDTVTYILFCIIFVVVSHKCPIAGCSQHFTDYTSYLRHLRMDHGAKYLPWTCAICYTGKCANAQCFLSQKGFIIHWKTKHPEVATAEEIVHPRYGSHFSFLRVQVLQENVEQDDENAENDDVNAENDDVNADNDDVNADNDDANAENDENDEDQVDYVEYNPDEEELQRDSTDMYEQ